MKIKKKKRIRNIDCNEGCVICKGWAIYHHVKTFGSGGETVPHNLMPLCVVHHDLMHKRGTTAMAIDHSSIFLWLTQNGWELCEFNNKWRHA